MELIYRTIFRDANSKTEFRDESYSLNETLNVFEPELPEELLQIKESIKEIVFLTGNKDKLTELKASLDLKNVLLSCPEEKIDLAEIQDSDVLNIVHDKCQRARLHLRGNLPAEKADDCQKVILVEDTCLNFEALHGMPGPYVKWFLEAVGPEGLYRMLVGFPNRAAEAICVYALMILDGRKIFGRDESSPEKESILFFRGRARGQIVEPRRGDPPKGWGWDPIFEEERSRLSFAEMEPEVKSKFSHRANALKVLRTFFET